MDRLNIRRFKVATCAAALCVSASGCGGGGETTARTQTTASPTAPGATAPRKDRPPPPEPGPAPGGERPVRVPASFTLRGGRLVPGELRVSPFLAVRLTVAALDGRAHSV